MRVASFMAVLPRECVSSLVNLSRIASLSLGAIAKIGMAGISGGNVSPILSWRVPARHQQLRGRVSSASSCCAWPTAGGHGVVMKWGCGF